MFAYLLQGKWFALAFASFERVKHARLWSGNLLNMQHLMVKPKVTIETAPVEHQPLIMSSVQAAFSLVAVFQYKNRVKVRV